jgi:hypothetical protein
MVAKFWRGGEISQKFELSERRNLKVYSAPRFGNLRFNLRHRGLEDFQNMFEVCTLENFYETDNTRKMTRGVRGWRDHVLLSSSEERQFPQSGGNV